MRISLDIVEDMIHLMHVHTLVAEDRWELYRTVRFCTRLSEVRRVVRSELPDEEVKNCMTRSPCVNYLQ